MQKKEKEKEKENDWANTWFLNPSLPDWEKELVAEELEVSIDTAEDMARKGELPISKIAASCSEGRERRKIIEHFDLAGKSVVERLASYYPISKRIIVDMLSITPSQRVISI